MRIISTTAILAATAIAAPALAGNPEMPQVHVRYADLDLARPQDVARLHRRVTLALESVCGSYLGADTVEANEISRCRAAAAARAQPMVAMLIAHKQLTDVAVR